MRTVETVPVLDCVVSLEGQITGQTTKFAQRGRSAHCDGSLTVYGPLSAYMGDLDIKPTCFAVTGPSLVIRAFNAHETGTVGGWPAAVVSL